MGVFFPLEALSRLPHDARDRDELDWAEMDVQSASEV